MDNPLGLCVELNDILYECKIQLPKSHFLQSRINDIMGKYQRYFRDQYNLQDQINKITGELE